MSYIGNPIVSTDFPKDTFSGNGSTTAFTLSVAPASVNAVMVIVSGVTQDPSTYTISGTTLTFSAAPPSGTSNISVRHLGVAGIPNTPSAASVSSSALNNLTTLPVSGGYTATLPSATGTLALTSDVIGVSQTWQAPSRAIGTTYTNSTGKPIMVAISYTCNAGTSVQGLVINGVTVFAGAVNTAGSSGGFTLIVPNGATYVTTTNVGAMTLVLWSELR